MIKGATNHQMPIRRRLSLSGLVVLIAVLVPPGMIMTVFGADSMAAGLAVSSLVLIAYQLLSSSTFSVPRSRAFLWLSTTLAVVAFIVTHGIVASGPNNALDWQRLLSSLLLVSIVWLGAGAFANWIGRSDDALVDRFVTWALWLLAVNGALGLSGVVIVPHGTFKASGYFSEPANLAITAAPFLVYANAAGFRRRRLILGAFFAWGILIQNLTILVVVAVAVLPRIRVSLKTLLGLGTVIALVAYALINPSLYAQYFLARLTVGPDSSNQSVLVFLRGWEYATLAFRYTGGVGLGFQQFGSQYLSGDILQRMELLGSGAQNQFDGGTAAAKIVGEFGTIGAVIIAAFAIWAFRMLSGLRDPQTGGLTRADVFFSASVLGLSVEVFVRGAGYFSPGMLMLMSSVSAIVLGFWRRRK